ncbi:MAG TPA: hypothetical protein VGF21_08080 [Thermoleophilaceae bacterium]|jgi:hypothetical protein
MPKVKKIIATAGAIALLAPSAAFAASGSEEGGYAGSNDVVAGLEQGSGGGNGGGGASPTTSGNAGGSLPFTGSDLSVIVGAGGMLLGLGFGLRRLTHRPTRA